MSKALHTCALCGKQVGRFGRWFHTYFAWAWWRPFDKSGPRRCARPLTRLLVWWVNVQHAYGWARNTNGLHRPREFSIWQCADFSQTAFGYNPKAEYHQVWRGELPVTSDPLEWVFGEFNRRETHDVPVGYKGRSVSVGDVVAVNTKAWACAPTGWKRVRSFRWRVAWRNTSPD